VGLFDLFKEKSVDKKIDNFIKIKIDSYQLVYHHLQFMGGLVNNKDSLKFYKTNKDNKSEWINFIKNIDCNYYNYTDNSIVIIHGGIIIVILFNWCGLYDVLNIFKNCSNMTESKSRIITITEFDIKQSLNRLSSSIYSIMKEFDTILRDGDIELSVKIYPKKAIFKNKIIDVPIDNLKPINKIFIYTDPQGYISSLRIDEKHPNADDKGWYCMGDLKRISLSVDNIKTIINNIEYYRLDDCYWRPPGFKKWFE
jgi:hypothetical protein